MTRPHPCYRCGADPRIDRGYGYTVACEDCYDGAPDSDTRGEVGVGLTREDAIQSWNELVAEVA